MKNVIIITLALFISFISFGQNDNYTTAMEEAIEKMWGDESNRQAAANTFERISQAMPNEWLPQYYAAYSNLMLGWEASERKEWKTFDAHFKKADAALAVAKEIAGEHSELLVMEAYILQGRIMRNPMINGPRFSSSIDALLTKAMELDENNPRAYHVLANQWLNMPSFLGGGVEKALPLYEKANEKFEKFEQPSSIYPSWGRTYNDRMLAYATKKVNG